MPIQTQMGNKLVMTWKLSIKQKNCRTEIGHHQCSLQILAAYKYMSITVWHQRRIGHSNNSVYTTYMYIYLITPSQTTHRELSPSIQGLLFSSDVYEEETYERDTVVDMYTTLTCLSWHAEFELIITMADSLSNSLGVVSLVSPNTFAVNKIT